MMDFDTFFRCFKSNTHSWYTFNFESANKKQVILHQSSSIFPEVILVSDHHSYNEKTIKFIVSMEVTSPTPQEKLSPLFWQPASKKNNTNPPEFPFSSIPLKNLKVHLTWSLQHSALNMCGCYFFFAEYKLVK